MRKYQQLTLAGLIGAAVFWLLAAFGNASARREAAAHGRQYVEDKPSKSVWVGLGALAGVSLGMMRRHPRLATMLGGLAATLAFIWKSWDEIDEFEHATFDGTVMRRQGSLVASQSSWPPPAAADTAGLDVFRGR